MEKIIIKGKLRFTSAKSRKRNKPVYMWDAYYNGIITASGRCWKDVFRSAIIKTAIKTGQSIGDLRIVYRRNALGGYHWYSYMYITGFYVSISQADTVEELKKRLDESTWNKSITGMNFMDWYKTVKENQAPKGNGTPRCFIQSLGEQGLSFGEVLDAYEKEIGNA